MTKILTAFSFLILISLSTYGQADKEYSKTLEKMFEVSGTEQAYQASLKEFFKMYKQQYPNIQAEIWEDLEMEFSQTSIKKLTKMLVPVYSKYLTKEDLEELIKFYESPAGTKFANSSPFIIQESMQIGQEWGQKIGEEFVNKMEEKGYFK